MDYMTIFQRASDWIETNTVEASGIRVNSTNPLAYPEVTGYYIPSLLRWGFKERAVQYARWLCDIQKSDGSWYDSINDAPYVFDSAQILKGLLAIRELMPEADESLRRGCDWILTNMQPDGRLTTPSMNAWGNDHICSELIHVYCLSPLKEAAEKLNAPQYMEAAEKIMAYYKANWRERIDHFNMLSHFYAYVMEGLADMGETALATDAMARIAEIQRPNGMIPAYADVTWTCSTALFQFAITWYKLGNIQLADKTFDYACSLQNPSGGWYGSYPTTLSQKLHLTRKRPDYFPDAEISWAVKFFLDALALKCRLSPDERTVPLERLSIRD